MVKLFVYDASKVHRSNYDIDKNPIYLGFRKALENLNPKSPFLVRVVHGDIKIKPKDIDLNIDDFGIESFSSTIFLNTFGEKSLKEILQATLQNGHDRNNHSKKDIYSKCDLERLNKLGSRLTLCDSLWAIDYTKIRGSYFDLEVANPLRANEDIGVDAGGFTHDFSLIMDAHFYKEDGRSGFFFQENIEKRRQALLGIILSNTNPREEHKSEFLRFDLNLQNLDEVLAEIHRKGYFCETFFKQS